MHTSYLYPLRLRGGYICYIIKPVPTYVVKTKHAWGQAFFMGFLLFLSDFMVPLIIFYIVGFAILGKRPVFDDFLYGERDGNKDIYDLTGRFITAVNKNNDLTGRFITTVNKNND